MSLIPGPVRLNSTSKLSLNERFKMVDQRRTNNGAAEERVYHPRPASKKNERLAKKLAAKQPVTNQLKANWPGLKHRLTGGKSKNSPGILAKQQNINVHKETTRAGLTTALSQRIRIKRNRNVGASQATVTPKRTRAFRQSIASITPGMTPTGPSSLAGRVMRQNHLRMDISNIQTNNRQNRHPQINNSQPNQRRGNRTNRNQGGGDRIANRRGRGLVGRIVRPTKNQSTPGNNNININTNNNTNNQRNRGARRGGNFRQRRGGRGGGRKVLDQNALDKDLETYMAKTRSHLDAELDAYMSVA